MMADAVSSLALQFSLQDGVTQELKRLESSVIRFVGAISSALTAFAIVGFPIKASADFQKQLLEAAKTTDFTREQVNELRKGLLDLSLQTNVSATDLAKIATLGGQLGISDKAGVQGLLQFTDSLSKAASALGVPVEEAGVAFGKLINIFDIPPNKFDNVISGLVKVSNASTATSTELFDVIRRIGDLGGSIDFPQAAALAGAMIDLGQTAETAGTTLTKIFSDMKSKAADFAAFIGISTEQWVKIVNTQGIDALNLFIDRLNQVDSTTAAITKQTLTGGGRIFETVTKLQNQRRRSNELDQEALRLQKQLDDAQTGQTPLSAEETKVLKERVDIIKQQAVETNIVSRLVKEAVEGYKEGAAAQKAQQIVLTGLLAQVDILKGRFFILGNTISTVVIPPLTEMVTALGNSLSSVKNIESLRAATEEIKKSFQDLFSTVSKIFSFLDNLGTGIDWGGALKFGVLLAVTAGIKGAITLLVSALRSIKDTFPVLQSLSSLFFGVSASANQAANAASRVKGATGAGISATPQLPVGAGGGGVSGVLNNLIAIGREQSTINTLQESSRKISVLISNAEERKLFVQNLIDKNLIAQNTAREAIAVVEASTAKEITNIESQRNAVLKQREGIITGLKQQGASEALIQEVQRQHLIKDNATHNTRESLNEKIALIKTSAKQSIDAISFEFTQSHKFRELYQTDLDKTDEALIKHKDNLKKVQDASKQAIDNINAINAQSPTTSFIDKLGDRLNKIPDVIKNAANKSKGPLNTLKDILSTELNIAPISTSGVEKNLSVINDLNKVVTQEETKQSSLATKLTQSEALRATIASDLNTQYQKSLDIQDKISVATKRRQDLELLGKEKVSTAAFDVLATELQLTDKFADTTGKKVSSIIGGLKGLATQDIKKV